MSLTATPAHRCRTCLNWGLWPAAEGRVGECQSINTSGRLQDMPSVDGALARGDGDSPIVLTGPNFGCVLWEPREDAEWPK